MHSLDRTRQEHYTTQVTSPHRVATQAECQGMPSTASFLLLQSQASSWALPLPLHSTSPRMKIMEHQHACVGWCMLFGFAKGTVGYVSTSIDQGAAITTRELISMRVMTPGMMQGVTGRLSGCRKLAGQMMTSLARCWHQTVSKAERSVPLQLQSSYAHLSPVPPSPTCTALGEGARSSIVKLGTPAHHEGMAHAVHLQDTCTPWGHD